MHRFKPVWAVLFLYWLLTPIQLLANVDDVQYDLFFYEDSTHHNSTLKEAPALPYSKAVGSTIVNGVTKNTIWAKIVLQPTTERQIAINIDRPLFDLLEIGYWDHSDSLIVHQFGFEVPDNDGNTTPMILVDPSSIKNNTLYVKARSSYSLVLPVRIKPLQRYYADRQLLDLFNIFLVGGLIVMMVYNFILWTSVRDFSYLIYSFGIFITIIIQLSLQGYVYQLIPQDALISRYFVSFTIGLNVAISAYFSILLLDKHHFNKWMLYSIYFVISGGLSVLFFELIGASYLAKRVMLVITLSGAVLLLTIGTILWYRKVPIAKYFQLSWTIYLIGIIVYGFSSENLISHNFFTNNFAHIGKFVEVCLMSFALGYKYNVVKRQNTELQLQLNKELEELVTRRTADLNKTLQEKDVLLKEIHHRVKNNLQVISSLLNIQSKSTSNLEAQEAMRGGQSRIKSMALIHQKLYSSDNLSQINMNEYTEQLVQQLQATFRPTVPISTTVDMHGISLDLDRAIPIGLILTELVMNAYKYAFEGKQHGAIEITLDKHLNSNYVLRFSDDGIGMTPINLEETTTLGLSLVYTLVEQINGQITMESQSGTVFNIQFSEEIT